MFEYSVDTGKIKGYIKNNDGEEHSPPYPHHHYFSYFVNRLGKYAFP